MTDVRVSRGHAEALALVDPDTRVSAGSLEAMGLIDPETRVSRGYLEVLLRVPPAGSTAVSRGLVEVLTRYIRIRTIESPSAPLIKNEDGSWSPILPMQQ